MSIASQSFFGAKHVYQLRRKGNGVSCLVNILWCMCSTGDKLAFKLHCIDLKWILSVVVLKEIDKYQQVMIGVVTLDYESAYIHGAI